MLLSFLPALLLLASPAEPRAPTVRTVDCEALLEGSAGPGTPDAWQLVASLVEGAEGCRAGEPVLAFALTQRALGLQPHAPHVRLAHARSLLALGERGAAAELLDAGLARSGPGLAPLRLLRAELALVEAEPERVAGLLAPLPASPRVQALRERARVQLQERAVAQEALAQHARAQAERELQAAQGPAPEAALPSGHEVWSTRGSVESGGQRTFRLRGVRAGGHYVLLATGGCTLAQGQKKRRRTTPAPRELFGVDFRARVGTLEAWPLEVGLEPERTQYTFRASEEAPQLLVEDRSAPRPGVRCSVRDLSVRVP